MTQLGHFLKDLMPTCSWTAGDYSNSRYPRLVPKVFVPKISSVDQLLKMLIPRRAKHPGGVMLYLFRGRGNTDCLRALPVGKEGWRV